MNNTKVTLAPLEAEDREQFILDNQESFRLCLTTDALVFS